MRFALLIMILLAPAHAVAGRVFMLTGWDVAMIVSVWFLILMSLCLVLKIIIFRLLQVSWKSSFKYTFITVPAVSLSALPVMCLVAWITKTMENGMRMFIFCLSYFAFSYCVECVLAPLITKRYKEADAEKIIKVLRESNIWAGCVYYAAFMLLWVVKEKL